MDSVGIVETKYFNLPGRLVLESGEVLDQVALAYETYGKLNADKSNAILIFHALSGDAHAAGKHSENDKKTGWWDNTVGPGKAFDTNKYFVICANTIGGCSGSTGPSSINPKTNQAYALNFPAFTLKDIVNSQIPLLDHFGIKKILVATGGSMGGMLALQFAISYPEQVKNIIAIAATARLSAQNIAFNEVGRRSIIHDSNWKDGNYYQGKAPVDGLSIARMIGHITYLSDESMRRKFGRKVKNEKQIEANFDVKFEVESYLRHQGISFTERFDANSYLYITKALDYFDLERDYGSLKKAFEKVQARFLLISFTSDWLFPAYQSLEVVKALKDNRKNVSYCSIECDYGHDAFLVEVEQQTKTIKSFLAAEEQG